MCEPGRVPSPQPLLVLCVPGLMAPFGLWAGERIFFWGLRSQLCEQRKSEERLGMAGKRAGASRNETSRVHPCTHR